MKIKYLLVGLSVLTGIIIMCNTGKADNKFLTEISVNSTEIFYTQMNNENYQKKWREVDSLIRQGLPKSALEIVDVILKDAKSKKNSDQIVKSFIYRLKLTHSYEEDSFENLIKELRSEIEVQGFPTKNIMHSMLGEMYMMYYQANQWRFNNRSQTVSFDSEDMKTWDLNRLVDNAIKHYHFSLDEAEKLKTAPVILFNESIVKGSFSEDLRPTLYDFVAHRAVDFFMNTQVSLSQPADKFELQEDYYFTDTKSFSLQEINSADTMSLHFHGVKVLQELLTFRLSVGNTNALIDADLKRIDFIYSHTVNPNKEELYFNLLKSMEEKYKNEGISSEITYRIAQYFNKRSEKYDPFNESTYKYKEDKIKAFEICNTAIEKFPSEEGTKKCKSLQCLLQNKSLTYQNEYVILPGKRAAVKVNYSNIKKVYLRVVSLDYKKVQDRNQRYNNRDSYLELMKMGSEVYSTSFDLPVDEDYNQHSTELLLNELPKGYYMLLISNSEEFKYRKYIVCHDFFWVSELSYIYRKDKNGNYNMTVVNRESGEPQVGVKAQAWQQAYNYKKQQYVWGKLNLYTTGSEGSFQLEREDNKSYNDRIEIEFFSENDRLYSNESFYLYNYSNNDYHTYHTKYFTDRAIYRPGQTVYFKGIVINSDGEQNKIVPGYSETVYLRDVNNQIVSKLDLKTNEFGTYSGTFQLPTSLMNGQFRIESSYGNISFSVEEYKRPKFEVELLPFDGNYRLKDKVTVKGKAKAFAGYNITDAKVAYRIVREPRWFGWWYRRYSSSPMEIANGTAITDDNGEFSIDFEAIPDLSYEKSEFLAFNYSINIDVTDLNGETQSTNKNLTIGYRSMVLKLDFPETIEIENSAFMKEKGVVISAKNLSGEIVNASGEIKIFSLKEPEQIFRMRKWEKPDKKMFNLREWNDMYSGNVYEDENEIKNLQKNKQVLQITFDTRKNKRLQINDFIRWKTGRYVAEVVSKDAFGQPITTRSYFSVYSSKDNTIPVNETDWFAVANSYGEPGENARFLVGSANKNVTVKYEIIHKDKVVLKEWIELNHEQKLISIPIEEKHRGNFSVHFTFVKNNRLYTHDVLVVVPRTDKKLDIEFSTFRDKLYPGQDEEWRLIIKGALGDKVAAEMLATLYDASLDQFRKNEWFYNIYRTFGTGASWATNSFNISNSRQSSYDANPSCYYHKPNYAYLNWFDFSYWNYFSGNLEEVVAVGYGRTKSAKRMSKSAPIAMDMAEAPMEQEEVLFAEERSEVEKNDQDKADSEKSESPKEEVQIRTNLNETAFFYPQLQTDEEGNLVIMFTIPEALTKWKMLGFAHTKDLRYGLIEKELVTQKDLMVVPNAPRFFRENDKMSFPVKITNISDINLSGEATLELFDGLTMQPIKAIYARGESKEKNFTVASEKSTMVNWNLEIPEGIQIITYRVIAKTSKFSDGEEKAIPVLTNRMLVTESMPLPIRGKQTREFEFTKLLESGKSSTLRHEKYTLEFTSNPAWYAVQALPYMMEYPYECSEQTFSRFYANSIAAHIANSSPKIQKVFESWKNTPDSKALLSNLEKNQELKSLLLEETPWVMNAQSESERKKRVGLLFDLNRMADELGRALKKLQKNQTINGGWPWFAGMPESRYITQHIVAGMGHLDKLGVKNVREDQKTWKMVDKAISFIDNEIKKEYDALKRYCSKDELKKNHLSYTAVHYLYTRSFFTNVKIPTRSKEAYDYYFGQSQKYWLSQGQYSKGLIALALHRYEDKSTPKKIVASLKENSLIHDELGMYWKTNVAGYYWYQAPIETQALMIEVFSEVTDDKKSVEELKLWLIKQKQTQDWKTTKATAEACYALLLQGSDWLASSELAEISVGNELIDPRKMDDVQVEAGTGYFKTSWSKTEIKPEMGKVKVKNPNDAPAWGAVYWQYFEQLDKITPHETPLKLQKKLFKEIVTKSGVVIEPIEKTDRLQVGDKIIVRIELRVDRMMEYVHMKDMRASGFEPINVISSYKWQDGLGYYESTKDAATNFFMDYLPKGTYVFEYPLRVTHEGDFSNGVTTIQCMYAPEFTSQSEGIRVVVE